MNDRNQAYEMSNNTWKLNFDVTKAADISESAGTGEGAAGTGAVQPQFQDSCRACVEILKVPDQEKYCVKFIRKGGSAMLFYDNANMYMDLLELCNNSTLEE